VPIDLQRPRDLGRILDDSFALYRAHWRTLLLVALVVVVPVHLAVFGAGLGWLWSGYDSTPRLADQLAGIVAQLLVVTPLVTAMTVHVVQAAAQGRKPAARETVTAGFEVFARLFGAVVLVALGVALGLVAFVIPGVILAVRWVAVPQVVVVEGGGGGAALARSMQLTRGQGWFTFLVLVVTNLLVGLLSALVLVPLELAAQSADAQALSLLGQALGAIISLPILAVAQTLLYFTLRARNEAAAPREPEPGAPAQTPGVPDASRPQPQTLPGVPGTYGDGWEPPTPPDPGPARTS
jgi:hypothetical protein